MNKTVLRALLTLFSAALFTAHTLVAMPSAYGTKGVLGGPAYSIGAAKSVTAITQQGNGTYDISYVVVVRNYGGNTLFNVQVTDDLQSTFPNPATFTVTAGPVASGTLTPNGSFNGTGDVNLITNASTLAPGAQETITFTVNVDVNGSAGTFYNTAIASGTDNVGGNAVADSSDWGTNPDPNLNNNPTEAGENTPTPTPVGGNAFATLGLAKTIVDTALVGCNYEITYQIVVRNYGTETLNNIQVTDLLTAAITAPATFTVGTVTTTNGLTPSVTAFDGDNQPNLLDPANSTLAVGATATITFTVTINPNGSAGTYSNSASGTATGAVSGSTTTDISDWGTNPDSDLDGNPNESVAENDPTIFKVVGPYIGVAKSVGAPQIQPDGSYFVTYTVTVKNLGTGDAFNVKVDDDLTQTFPAPVVATVQQPGIATGQLVWALGYGTSTWNMLEGNSVLPAGAQETITFTVKIDLNNTTDTLFNNVAIAAAIGEGNCGIYTQDSSADGSNPEPSLSSPTPVVLLPSTTTIPGGYSPNGDGINDFFVINNIGGKKVDVQIFNRWGAPVYTNANYDNTWNGTANTGFGLGEDLPTGTYWYIIKIDDSKDVKEYANYLTLTR